MRKELEPKYDPKQVEDKIYGFWTDNKYFHAEIDPDKKPYTIVIPPPNITGQLHMGHALDETLQDILIRYKRMQGYAALWLPGTDHAAIATEAKIVASMREEGITKEEIGRDAFMERAWAWKEKYGGRIVEQLKKLGSSCDWDRERFTMDEGCSKAVRETFVRYYEKGLIYRGERMVNWCPKCKTTLSDAEVEFEDQAGHFWHIKYPYADGTGYIELATTRPETLLGDTAVAVNPEDAKYKDVVGKMLILPLVGREIPVIADDYVEMDFGTGAVKITPAHDPNDFEVGKRHNLEVIDVLTDDAKIVEGYGKYSGLDRYEARKAIVKDLEEQGFLIETEDYSHNVGTCYRCGTTIEPKVSTQWFVKMEPLAGPAIEAVKSGETKFVPERFDKIYFNWLENIRDWCISRQIWWGHRIPAFYCDECGEMVVSKEDVHTCPKCGAALRQDEDTLDTWFSSALWPFSTLGWPENTEELKYFYPTNTLVTGYDIIFFWVIRMMFSGIEHMGKAPFNTVLIHGLVRDSQGRKMSKSLGNGIDPLEEIDKYGADALRFMLATGNAPGNDMRYMDEKVISARNFTNKLWNASRYILMNLPEDMTDAKLPEKLAIEDRWILGEFNKLAREVTENLDSFELGVALSKVYDFIWNVYCDYYIELTKPRIQAGGETALAAQNVLVFVMQGMLKLLHPFMPFITEEIWQAIPSSEDAIIVSKWPEYNAEFDFADERKEFAVIIEAVTKIRNLRNQYGIAPSKALDAVCAKELSDDAKAVILTLTKVSVTSGEATDGGVKLVTELGDFAFSLDELVDKEKELARLDGEKKKVQADIDFLSGKLSNEKFVSKAPEKLIAETKEKLSVAKEKMARIEENLKMLG